MYPPEFWRPLRLRSVRARVIKAIEPLTQAGALTNGRTILKCGVLPFYETALLIRVEDPRWLNSQYLYLIADKEEVHILEGVSNPIHALNASVPIKLSAANVASYLRFFGFFVRAEEGPFYVLTGRDDPFWPHSLPEAVQLDLEARILRCNTSLTLQADGDYALDALVQYGRNFFEAHFEIESSSGRVDMISDEPLAFDAAQRIHAPLKGSGQSAGRARRSRDQTSASPSAVKQVDAPPQEKSGQSAPEVSQTTTVSGVETAREKNLAGMRQAAQNFAELTDARFARDFFYHWPLSLEQKDSPSGLPESTIAQVRRAMDVILEHADGHAKITEARVRVLKQIGSTEGLKPSEKSRIEKLLAPLGFRMSPSPEDFCRLIRPSAPHMGDLIKQIATYLRLSHRIGDGRVKLPPVLLVGPPSSGKSWAARKICEALDLPSIAVNGGGASDNRFLAGTARGWSTATASAPVDLLMRAEIANPAVIIEEIDKASGDRNGSIHHSLLTLLEPLNSSQWLDEYVGAPVDLSHINWFATANEIGPIPEPLLNRFTVMRVKRPTTDEVVGMIDILARDVVAGFGSVATDDAVLSKTERETLIKGVETNQWGFRDLRRAILEALGNPAPPLQLVG